MTNQSWQRFGRFMVSGPILLVAAIQGSEGRNIDALFLAVCAGLVLSSRHWLRFTGVAGLAGLMLFAATTPQSDYSAALLVGVVATPWFALARGCRSRLRLWVTSGLSLVSAILMVGIFEQYVEHRRTPASPPQVWVDDQGNFVFDTSEQDMQLHLELERAAGQLGGFDAIRHRAVMDEIRRNERIMGTLP